VVTHHGKDVVVMHARGRSTTAFAACSTAAWSDGRAASLRGPTGPPIVNTGEPIWKTVFSSFDAQLNRAAVAEGLTVLEPPE
jgi:hypothetical protein